MIRTQLLNMYGGHGSFSSAVLFVAVSGIFFVAGSNVLRRLSGEAPKDYPLVALVILSMLPMVLFEWIILSQFRPRARAIRSEARRLGLRFFRELNEFNEDALSDRLTTAVNHDFHVFGRGTRRLFNVLCGQGGSRGLLLFDLEIVKGPIKDKDKYWQTVCQLESDELNLPAFRLRPRSFGRPRLTGPDKKALAQLFDAGVLEAGTPAELCVEGRGRHLLIYRPRRLVAPARLEAFIAEARRLQRLFLA